ncbi:hypothetical protein CEXT_2041 [Caerostris extrusa]|uniref:Secreted protein n=1 Tax=Caerostris extrusa TaxID=172846 RepID=A0AAV4VM72_CAEEX|nr:hypothetical protein CEXT_2041 [Caerostris extrusa]
MFKSFFFLGTVSGPSIVAEKKLLLLFFFLLSSPYHKVQQSQGRFLECFQPQEDNLLQEKKKVLVGLASFLTLQLRLFAAKGIEGSKKISPLAK